MTAFLSGAGSLVRAVLAFTAAGWYIAASSWESRGKIR